MEIPDILDLLLLISKGIPRPFTGSTECDGCDSFNIDCAMTILRNIDAQYNIKRKDK